MGKVIKLNGRLGFTTVWIGLHDYEYPVPILDDHDPALMVNVPVVWGDHLHWTSTLVYCGPAATEPSLPQGLCSDRRNHLPHTHSTVSLGWFWCSADHEQHEPYRSTARWSV